MVPQDRPQITIWRLRIACWIMKTTNTHSECVILIAFPLLQWLHERAQCYVTRTLAVLFSINSVQTITYLLRILVRYLLATTHG